MQRRQVLAICGAGLAGLAGCSGNLGTGTDSGPSGEEGTTPTDTGTPTETLPAACPTTLGLGVEWPSPPTADAAATFVREYERAYLRDEEIPEGANDVYVEVTVEDTTERGAGYLVDATITYGWCGKLDGQPTPEGEATRTPVCVDAMDVAIQYYVTDRVVRRLGRTPDETTARRDGTLVECRRR